MQESLFFYKIKANVNKYQWIWDFFEAEEEAGRYKWPRNEPLQFHDHQFYFENSVFTRARKEKNKDRTDVFEELADDLSLGFGAFGEVKPIILSLSQDKENKLQVRDKHRVVKIFNSRNAAETEYQRASQTKHLHVKPSHDKLLVMKEKKGVNLLKWLENKNSLFKGLQLSREERIALTKSILIAVKEQVHDNDLIHNDLAARNILAHRQTDHSGRISFKIAIIDFNLAAVKSSHPEGVRQDFLDLNALLFALWKNTSIPYPIKKISQLLVNPKTRNLDGCLNFAEKLTFFPRENQFLIDKIFIAIDKLSLVDSELAQYLDHYVTQTLLSNPKNSMLQEMVNHCRIKLKTFGFQKSVFSKVIFNLEKTRQRAINQQFEIIKHFKNKARRLKEGHFQEESQALYKLTGKLKKQLALVAKVPSSKAQEAWLTCQEKCQNALKKNKKALDLHLNPLYLFAEFAVVLASLIVFYPIIAGLQYKATGRLGFFTQTEASRQAELMSNNFTAITAPT